MASTLRIGLYSMLAGTAAGAAAVAAVLFFRPEWKDTLVQSIIDRVAAIEMPDPPDSAPGGSGTPTPPRRPDFALWDQYHGQAVEEIVAALWATPPPVANPPPPPLPSLQVTPPPGLQSFPFLENRQETIGIDLSVEDGAIGDIAVADFNGDRFLDVAHVTNEPHGKLRLFGNRIAGAYRDISGAFGIDSHPGGVRLLVNDFNNDGFPDLLILRGDRFPNSLLENVGGASFRDVTESAGLLDFFDSKSAAWADFDQDGWLDLCIVNDDGGRKDPRLQLFRNGGDGTFTDLAQETRLSLAEPAVACVWLDIDQDGYPEILLLSETSGPQVFRSVPAETPEDWRFEEIAADAGLQAFPPGGVLLAWHWNNEAWPGLAGGNPLRVFSGSEGGRFEDVTEDLEIPAVKNAPALAAADLDGDGAVDLLVGTGPGQPNRVFWNRNGDRFRDVSEASGLGFAPRTEKFLPADLDLDGDIDVLALAPPTPGGLFENPGQDDHRWLRLSLEGKTANRSAIGARVSLVVRDLDWILRPIELTVSAPRPLEIGLGNAASIESLTIAWPARSRPTSEYKNLPLDAWVRVREGESGFDTIEIPPPKPEEKTGPENDPEK